jgi:general L-amino acid transport system permease protein
MANLEQVQSSTFPRRQTNPIAWMQQNLFNSVGNSLLTLLCLAIIGGGLVNLVHWATTAAQWSVVGTNLRLFFIGRYPPVQAWRIGGVAAIALLLAILWGIQIWLTGQANRRSPGLNRLLLVLTPLALLGMFWLINGDTIRSRTPILRFVPTNLWGGLMLTLFVATISILLAFPLGVGLALARQSKLPVVRGLSTLYIELVRGLPLIGILFMAQVMLPLVLPGAVNLGPLGVQPIRLDRLLRAIAGLVLFNAAYLAENVRGGLQSIPRGQVEAAKSLGMNTLQTLGLIVLPQALRAVVPAIVGQFISLFKDTSLLSLFALIELTGIGRSVLAQPQFLGRYAEVYLFIGVLYWLVCYGMSQVSRRLERGER